MKEKSSKFVGLAQIYPEVGVHFENIFPWEKAKEWRIALERNLIPDGIFKKKHKDYQLVFLISASTLIGDLLIKGPTISKRNKTIDYVLWIPYARVVNDPKPLTKLTEYFKQGVAEVLRKLEYPEESIQKVLKKITDKPVEIKK